MESFINRYRSITVLLLVIFGQLVLLAVTEKNDQNVTMFRSWTGTAVYPVARILAWGRNSSVGFVRNYVLFRDASEENRELKSQLDRLKVENVFLKNEVNMADRAKALQLFAAHTPSKTLAATVYGTAAGPDSNAVMVDRGTASGVQRGMGVVTPDGIVGKVIWAHATYSMVRLVTDQDFAAGVVSQNGLVRGVLKGQGKPNCKVDYVPFEDKLAPGDLLFTSGDDHIFPRGFPVGVVKSVSGGQPFKDIMVEPAGLRHGIPEDVLIVVEGVHQELPEPPASSAPVYINPGPPPTAQPDAVQGTPTGTEADRMRSQAKTLGESQGHVFGTGDGKIPDFNAGKPIPQAPPAAQPAATAPPAAPKPSDSSRRANQAAGVPATGGRQNR